MRAKWESLVGFHGRRVNFGSSRAPHKAPQPKSGLILKCHFAEGKDPWPWLRCKTPNPDSSCKTKELRLFFLCPSHPGDAQQERVLHAKPWSASAKGIPYLQRGSSPHCSNNGGLDAVKENSKPYSTPGNTQTSEKFTH